MIYLPRWKIAITVVVCLLGILFSIPNILSKNTASQLPSWFPKDTLSLGLDLQGGSHILLEVDIESAIKDRLASLADALRSSFRKEKIGYQGLKPSNTNITFRLRDVSPDVLDRAQKTVSQLNHGSLVSQFTEDGHAEITFSTKALDQLKISTMEQSIQIVRRRVDETGTKEPSIQQQGSNRIVLQLPGIDDPAQVKKLLGKTAKLSFKMVDHSVSYDDILMGRVPAGSEVLESVENGRRNSSSYKLAVRKISTITGDMLVDAQPGLDENQRPVVTFKFNPLGAKKFAEATRENVGKQFAIILDGKIISAPSINSPIPGGSGQIFGNFTVQETQDLSLLLRAGALPAPLKVLEERTVGPDLGADSIMAGEQATIYAIVLVGIFMIAAYAFFGFVANIALIFNIIFLIAGLSVLQATLTLPGIAGIALTIGMAVDANVLIYERIKEELRSGKHYLSALQAGYKRAMATIFDSNLTTLIGALFLYQFGTGPVRGFAVTLALGIIISMFTAITLTRVVVSLWLKWRHPKQLSI